MGLCESLSFEYLELTEKLKTSTNLADKRSPKDSYGDTYLYAQLLGGRRQVDQKFKTIFSYIVSLSSVWARWDPVQENIFFLFFALLEK